MELVLPRPPLLLGAASAPLSDEARLLERARRGEVGALDCLLNAHRGRILNLCFQVLRVEADAEDAAQETFVRAFSKLDSFRGASGFGTWLYRVALNVCLERRRMGRPTEALSDELHAPPTSPDERLALEWALDQLSEPLRLALILREWHGLSYEEIAGALHLPIGTVRSRLSAAREEFRRVWTLLEEEAQ